MSLLQYYELEFVVCIYYYLNPDLTVIYQFLKTVVVSIPPQKVRA